VLRPEYAVGLDTNSLLLPLFLNLFQHLWSRPRYNKLSTHKVLHQASFAMKNLKLLFQLILFYATFIPSFALPTETSSAPDPRALKLLSVEDITESDTLDVRSDNIVSEVLDLKPRATGPPQTFHLIGFTSDQGIRVRRAIGEAAWMGEMGNQHLARINSFNDLSPEFRTYFGNSFDTTNMDVIRSISCLACYLHILH
jgi:hypothetical protein